MKKVTVNGVDHELSPDSPRSRSHVELLQDICTSINELEDGETMSGIELASTLSADNVISSATTNADASNAAMTFHNIEANSANELEFNFTDSGNVSLLKIDNEGDVTALGGLSLGGANVELTGSAAHVISGAASDANTTASVAAMTLKNTIAHTTGDLEFDFQKSTGDSLLKVDADGYAVHAGPVSTRGGLLVANLAAPVAGAFSTSATGGDLVASTTYSYWITATNAVGESLPSARADQATGAEAPSTHSITLNWGVVPGAIGYKIYRATSSTDPANAKLKYTITSGATLTQVDTTAAVGSDALNTYVDSSGSLNFTGGAPVLITSAASDANTSASVAAMTFKNTVAHTSSDLEFDFVNSAGNSLLTISGQGLTRVGHDAGGNLVVTGLVDGTYIQMSNSPARINCYGATGVTDSAAALTVQSMTAQDASDLILDVQRSDNTSLFKVDNEGDTTIAGTGLTSSSALPFVLHTSGTAGNVGNSGSAAFTIKNDQALDGGDIVFEVLSSADVSRMRLDNSGTLYTNYVAAGSLYADTLDSGASGVTFSAIAGTAGSATGVSMVKRAGLCSVVHKVTVTEAALTDAATSQAVTLWTVPAKTRIVRIVADVTAAFTGGGTTAGTLEVGITGTDTDAYLKSLDIFTAPITAGRLEAELGDAVSRAGTGALAYPAAASAFTGTTAEIHALFTSTTANVADFTTGSVTFYIECSTYL